MREAVTVLPKQSKFLFKSLLFVGVFLFVAAALYLAPYAVHNLNLDNSHFVPQFAKAPSVYAASQTNTICNWAGASGAGWNTASNWNCPTSATHLVPQNSSCTSTTSGTCYWVNIQTTNKVVLDVNATVSGVNVGTTASGAILDIGKASGSNTLTLQNTGTLQTGFTAVGMMQVGLSSFTGTVNLVPATNVTCLTTTSASGQTIITSGSTVSGATTNGGTCTWSEATAATVTNAGTMSGTFTFSKSGAAGLLANSGTISGSVSMTLAGSGTAGLTNTGTINLSGGTVTAQTNTQLITCSATEANNNFFNFTSAIATTFRGNTSAAGACKFSGTLTYSGTPIVTLGVTTAGQTISMTSSNTMALYAMTIGAGAAATLKSNTTLANNLVFTASTTAQSLTQNTGVSLGITGTATLTEVTAAVISAWNINDGSASVTGLTTLGGSVATASFINKIVLTTGTLTMGALTMGTDTTVTNQVIDTSAGAATVNISGAITNPTKLTISAGTSSTWNYNGAAGGTTFPAATYQNLTFSNTSGIYTAAAATTVNGTLTTTSGGTMAMSTFQLLGGGSFSPSNGGTITTTNTTNPAIPANETWAGTVTFAATAGAQSVPAGTYNNLTFSNTSATNTAVGALVVNGTLTTTSGGTVAMVLNQLSGTMSATNNGTITTTSTADPAIPTGLTWTGTTGQVTFAATAGGQFVPAGTYGGLTFSNTSLTDTARGAITATTLTTTAGGTLDMATYDLAVTTPTNSGTLKTQSTSSTPISSGKTWAGTVEYGATTGSQTIVSETSYATLKLDNSSGTDTAGGNLVANTALTTTSGGVLDMTAAYTLGGTLTTITNPGTIKTAVPTSTSATPLAAGKTWGGAGTIEYTATNGGQTLVNGTYTNNLLFDNTSGTNTVTASTTVTANGTLTTTAGGTLDFGTTSLLAGTLGTITNNGTIKTAVPTATSATPLAAGKTWGGTGLLEYSATTGAQTVMGGTYNCNLQLDNTSGTDTAAAAVTANAGLTTTSGGTLAMSTFQLLGGGSFNPTNGGTITTTNTTNPAIPSGETWGGTVTFAATAGAQFVPAGTYSTLNFSNTSATDTAAGAITTTTLTTTAGGTLDMVTNDLAVTNITNAGTIKTQDLSATPVSSGLTWAGTVNYNATTGGQTIIGGTYTTLTLGNTSGTDTMGSAITATTMTTTASGVYTNNTTVTVSGTFTNGGSWTQGNGSTLNVGGLTTNSIAGAGAFDASTNENTVNYSATTGGQTIKSTTYRTLTLSNSSGTDTAGGALTVNTALTTTSGGIVDMSSNQLLGTLTVTNAATFKVGTTSNPAFPTGLTWGGTVEVTRTNGGSNIPAGTYNNLTFDNTSGTHTAVGAWIVNGTLTTTSGGTVAMVLNQLSGTMSATNNGTITTTSTADPAIPTGLTWTGTTGQVTFAATAGGQFVPAGTYGGLTFSNTSLTDTARGAITVASLTTTAGGTLNMATYDLAGLGTSLLDNGSLQTQDTSATPIPSGKTWGSTVNYNAATGGQAIIAGSYINLTLGNTSGTDTIDNAVTTSNLNTTSGGSITNNSTVSVTSILTNAGNWTQGTSSSVTVGSTFTNSGSWVQGSSSTLTVGGAGANAIGGAGTFDASTNPNTVNYNAIAGGQTVKSTTYSSLTLSNTSLTNTAGGTITVNATLTTTSGGILAMSTYQLLGGGSFSVTNNGTITTSNVSNPAIPAGEDWTGTTGAVTFAVTTGTQYAPAGTYNNLTFSNSSGTDTVVGDITVNGTLTTTTGGIVDMQTNQLSGALTYSGNGTLKTSAVDNPPLPAGVTTWGGTVQFAATGGGQYVPAGTYKSLTFSNTSGTDTAVGDIVVNTGTFTTTAGGTLDMTAAYVLSGTATFASASSLGILLTAVPTATNATPIPANKTWGGTVNFNAAAGAQTVPYGSYATLTFSNSSGTDTVSGGTLNVVTLTTTAGGTLNMATNDLFVTNVTNNGTLETQDVSATPISNGKTYAGTVLYDATSGGQTIITATYNNLTLSNTSGTSTASSTLTVNGTLTTTAGGTLDMSSNQLLGTVTPANSGTFKTSNTTNPPYPASKTWGGTVQLAFATGTQSIPAGTYNNLTFLNTSGTDTAVGALTVNGTLITTASGTLDMTAAYTLAGTLATITNDGTIKTSVSTATSATPIATGKTWGGAGTVSYLATSAQTVVAGTYNNLAVGTQNDANVVTYSLAGNTTINGTLTVGNASGSNHTFDQGSSTYTLASGAVTIAAHGIWTNTGTGNITLSGDVANAGTITIETSGHSSCGVAGADTITVTTSDGATDRAWSGAGTFNIWDVNAIHQTGAGVTAHSSTQGTGSTWTFVGCGITISGTIYQTSNETLAFDCTTNISLHVSVNGGSNINGTCSASDGTFTINNVTDPAGADIPIVVFSDSAAAQKITTVTLSSAALTNISGLKLFIDRVAISQESATAMTNALMATGDNGDSGIRYSVSSGNLTVESGMELHIMAGKLFTPGGTVTTTATGTTAGAAGDVHIDTGATMTMGTNALNIGGDYTNSGTFAKSSGQTTTFTATGTGFTITPGTGNLDAAVFNGSGGAWTTSGALTIDGALTITAGTLHLAGSAFTVSGASSITGSLDTVTSATGTKAFTGAVTVNSSGSFDMSGQNPVVTFGAGITNNSATALNAGSNSSDTIVGDIAGTGAVTFGGGLTVSSGTTTNSNTGLVTVTGTLTLTGNWTQGANSSLSVGQATAFSGAGTLDASTNANTVIYTANAPTCKSISYSSLTFSGASGAISCPITSTSGTVSSTGGETWTTSLTSVGAITLSGTATMTSPTNLAVSGAITLGSGTAFNNGTATTAPDSDSFTGTDGTALATHDSNWVSMDASRLVGGLQINSNQVRTTTAFNVSSGAMYNSSSADTSQITAKAYADTAVAKNVCVRGGLGGGANQTGYCFKFTSISSGNWTAIQYRKNGSFLGSVGSLSYATASDHTLKITASGTSTVTLTFYIDGTSIGTYNDSSSPLGTGHPGFYIEGNGNQANNLVDDWTDGDLVPTSSASSVAVTGSGTFTNNGTLTLSTGLSGSGTFTNGAVGVLNVDFASAPSISTLTATASGNTVNYTAASPSCMVTTYYHLNFTGSGTVSCNVTTVNGNLATSGTVSWSPTSSIALGGNLTVGGGTTVSPSAGTWTLGTGTFTNSGTFAASGSHTFIFTVNGATIPSATYNNLQLTPSNSSPQVLSSGTLTINGNLTIGDGTNAGATASANNPTILVTGSMTIASGATFVSTSGTLTLGGNFVNNGTFTHNNGTVAVAPAVPTNTTSIGGSSNTNFYNFTANDSGLANNSLTFNHGLTYGFYGTATLGGSSTLGKLVLDSDDGSDQWTIYVDPSATYTFSYVIVRDAACDNGSKTIAPNDTIIDGGNDGACWSFISHGSAGVIGGAGGGGGSGGGGGILPQRFTGSDSTALTSNDANWTLLNGNFAINTNAIYSNTAATDTMAKWTAGSFNDNQYAQITLSALASGSYIGVGVRLGSDQSGYGAYSDSNTAVKIIRWDSGTPAVLYTGTAFSTSDVLRLEISSTTLTLKQNGTVVTTVVDTTYSTGKPGLVGYGNSTSVRGDNWYAGSLSSQGGGGGGGSGGGGGVLPQTFTASNGTTLTQYDSNWSMVSTGNFVVNSNTLYGNSHGQDVVARWTAGSFNDNQYSEITIASLDSSSWIGTAVRLQGGSYSGYYVQTNSANYEIGKRVNGVYSTLLNSSTPFGGGDVLRLEISGTTLTLKRNGTVVDSVVDTTYSSGSPGVAAFDNSGGSGGDNWYAGSLSSGGGGGGGGGP